MGVKPYDKPFKGRAFKLRYQRRSVSPAARELGVSDSQLSKWRKEHVEYGEDSFRGRGIERMTDGQREIRSLQNELKES